MTKTPFRLSITRVKAFKACPMAWYLEHVQGVPVPPRPNLELGTEVHAILESYLRGEITLEEIGARAAEKAKPYAVAHRGLFHLDSALPLEGIPLGVETWVRDEILGISFTGKIDCWWVDGEDLHILDHKTSSDPKKWALTPEDAWRDLQLRAYAYLQGKDLKGRGIKRAFGHLIYYPTKAGQARRVDTPPWRASDLIETWGEIKDITQEMINTVQSGTPEKNLGACSNYGGCPFAGPNGPCAMHKTKEETMDTRIEYGLTMLKPFNNPTPEQFAYAAQRAGVELQALKDAFGATAPDISPRVAEKVAAMADRIRRYVETTRNYVATPALQKAAAECGVGIEVLAKEAGLVLQGEDKWVQEIPPEVTPEAAPEVTPEVTPEASEPVPEAAPEASEPVPEVTSEPAPKKLTKQEIWELLLAERAKGTPDISKWEESNKALADKAQQLEETVSQLELALDEEDSAHDAEMKELQGLVLTQENTIKQLESNLEKKEKTLQEIDEERNTLESALEEKESLVGSLQKREEGLQRTLSQMVKDLEAAMEERDALIREIVNERENAPASPPQVLVDATSPKAVPLEMALLPYFQRVEDRLGILDLGLVDYGKGYAEAAAYLQGDIRSGNSPLGSGVWSVSKDAPWWKYVERAIIQSGAIIIRGTR